MRVATRRTRAALSLFEEALPVRSRHVRTELGWLADAPGSGPRSRTSSWSACEGWIRDVPNEDAPPSPTWRPCSAANAKKPVGSCSCVSTRHATNGWWRGS